MTPAIVHNLRRAQADRVFRGLDPSRSQVEVHQNRPLDLPHKLLGQLKGDLSCPAAASSRYDSAMDQRIHVQLCDQVAKSSADRWAKVGLRQPQPLPELSLLEGGLGVDKMRRCRVCGRANDELLGVYCARCDEIAGDVWAGLAAELGVR